MQVENRKTRLISRISLARLSTYGDLSKDPLEEILARYLWNCALSESLYQSLHWLEITLRNNICTAAEIEWGEDWLTNYELLPFEKRIIQKAKERISKEGKYAERSDITAALNFGFWHSLFRKQYEYKIRALLPKIFPYTKPASLRTRKNISDRINTIRKFRNRVFHFEHIIKYKPEMRYAEIRQLIEWTAPEIIPLLEANCKFEDEFASGSDKYIAEARKILSDFNES